MRFTGSGLLLDIEGTTSSIRFVFEVMFPFVREHLDEFLHTRLDDADVRPALDALAADAGYPDWDGWVSCCASQSPADLVQAEVLQLMDRDAKTTGLKSLQGLIWEDGFRSGELTAHVYDEVPGRLRDWKREGWDIRIYSSGSVHAQRLFFGHTQAGDLLPLFSGHYDTTLGGKKEAASYQQIAEEFGRPAAELLFVSDVVAELDAAAEAGWATALSIRPENPPQPTHAHPEIRSFDDLDLQRTPAR